MSCHAYSQPHHEKGSLGYQTVSLELMTLGPVDLSDTQAPWRISIYLVPELRTEHHAMRETNSFMCHQVTLVFPYAPPAAFLNSSARLYGGAVGGCTGSNETRSFGR
jgi:hypothetical protein